MSQILVTYSTLSGSTVEVAEAIRDELSLSGHEVDLHPVAEPVDIEQYDAIVVGGPMILGWHREARRFIRKNRPLLKGIPFAVFATAMSLTNTDRTEISGVPVFIDENLPKIPEDPVRLSIRERYATIQNYVSPILRIARPEKPVSVALFGGQLNYGRLKWWALLFAMLIVREEAGDKRNWEAIRGWARALPIQMGLQHNEV